MGITHGFAPARENDQGFFPDSPELVFFYDLDGNVLDVNDIAERILGYGHGEAVGMSVAALMSEDSHEYSVQRMRAEMTRTPRSFEITTLTKQRRPLKITVTRGLLFEGGRPIAIQDRCRPLSAPNPAAPGVASQHSTNSIQLAQFAERLKQLNRLSTTRYDSLEQAFEDHL